MVLRSILLACLALTLAPLPGCAQAEDATRAPAEETAAPAVTEPTVKTELVVEYTKKTGEKVLLQKKQELKMAGSERDFQRKFAASFELTTNKELPLQVQITNVWESLEDRSKPLVSLPFDFQKKQIESGKLYVCPQIVNEQSGCRVQLVSPRVDLGIATEEAICKLKIQTEGNLDFSKSDRILTVSAYPTSIYEDGREGKAFALAFECSNRGQVLLKGHFLHNTTEIPTL